MYEGVTEKVIDFALKTKFEDLNRETIDKIKLMLLDSIGCALGSYVTDRAKLAIEFVEESGGNPQATIIGAHRTSCAQAAFVNGELINALDYESLGPLTGHVSPYVTSPCLAIAEKVSASGKEVIMALALAHEIGGRVGASLGGHTVLKKEPPYYEEAQRFSHSSAIFGGVAGASKLLGLDAKKMANAFGIAGASCTVPAGIKYAHIAGPAIMTKYNAWAGWVAQLGTVAAMFADKGFTGDTTILDGELGFWKIVGAPFFKVETLLGGLGEVWHIDTVEFKPYPTCRNHHAGIEAITTVIQEHGIRPEDIEQIRVRTDPMLQRPDRTTTRVESFADMQHSNVNIFAMAAFHGARPSPGWQMAESYNDPRVMSLAKKVRVEVHPRAEEALAAKVKAGKWPAFRDAIVEITVRGKTYTGEVTALKGTPANPMTDTEIIEKFKVNASYSMLKSSRVTEIIKTIDKLERLDDFTTLTSLLTVS